EEIDGDEPPHLGFDRVIEPGVAERLEEPIGAHGEDGGAAGTGEVAKGMGEKRLADADGADDGDVLVLIEEAERGELLEERAVEGDAGGVIPALDAYGGIEPGLGGADGDGVAVAPAHLVGEDREKQILVRELVLAGEREPIGQRRENER